MKKHLITLVFIGLAFGAYSQTDTTMQKEQNSTIKKNNTASNNAKGKIDSTKRDSTGNYNYRHGNNTDTSRLWTDSSRGSNNIWNSNRDSSLHRNNRNNNDSTFNNSSSGVYNANGNMTDSVGADSTLGRPNINTNNSNKNTGTNRTINSNSNGNNSPEGTKAASRSKPVKTKVKTKNTNGAPQKTKTKTNTSNNKTPTQQ